MRVFHWSLATLLSGGVPDEAGAGPVHIAAGYAIAELIALRLAWEFVDPRHARFSNFVRSPRQILAYLRDVARRSVRAVSRR